MSRHIIRARAGESRANLYDEVTGKIVAELEAGLCALGTALGHSGSKSAAGDAEKRIHGAAIRHPQGSRLIGQYDSQVAFGQSLLRHQGPSRHHRVYQSDAGNLPPMPGVFPDYTAPVVRNAPDGERELMLARWGMPGPPQFAGAPSRTSATP